MKTPKLLTVAIVLTLMMSAAVTMSTHAAPSSISRTLIYRGTTAFPTTPATNTTPLSKPFRPAQHVNRSLSPRPTQAGSAALRTPHVASTLVDNDRPGLTNSFEGLNEYTSAVANGFPLEPPDQGICAGQGYVLETTNDVLQTYTPAGGGYTPAVSLNVFFHEDPSRILLSDPSCYYDHNTQRWFQVVLALEFEPTTGSLTGPNHIDIAVSTGSNPANVYTLYSFPVQDDGTAGTPYHQNCPCIGDFPHLGADKYGFYVTTNEYPLFTNGFNGAQVYALSKQALAQGAASIQITQFDNLTVSGAGTTAFTVWPAVSPTGSHATSNGGTEFFLSSMAAQEAGNTTGSDNRLGVWALTNTQSLDGSGSPTLISTTINSETYVVPPLSNQKSGRVPLADCLDLPACATEYFGSPAPYFEHEGPLDSSDTRMFQTTYANGLLWGALDTGVNVNGAFKAGVAYFVVHPTVSASGDQIASATMIKQGYLATADNNVIYPAIGVLATGKAVMAVNVVGRDYYPSAAYVTLNVGQSDTSAIHIAAAGNGPEDGVCEYRSFGCSGTAGVARPRWGDYGAAAVTGGTVYFASEYIAQTCSFAEFFKTPTCGETRDLLANWSTRVSSVTP